MMRALFFRVLPFCVALLIVSSAAAQLPNHSSTEPIQITGIVRYAATGQPADEVYVRLDRVSGGYAGDVRTDRLGKFRFTGLLPVQYQLEIRHPGYLPIQREINLVMTSAEYVQLSLVSDKTSSSSAPPVPSTLVLDANVPLAARKEFEKGTGLLAVGKKDKTLEAIKHFENAVSIYPKFLEAQLKLGTAYMDVEDWPSAEASLRRAIEIDRRAANAHFALGELYSRQKKYKQAEAAIREGLAVADRSWQGRFALARVYWEQGEVTKAGRQVALTLQLNPNFADAHLLAGNIFLRVDHREEAIAEFQDYLRLAPHGPYADQAKAAIEKLKSVSRLH